MSILGKIWENRYSIAEGIKNSIFKKEDVEAIAEQRMKICAECPDLDIEGSKCAVAGTAPCCGQCGCKISFKIRSLSSGCGNEENPRWDPIITQEEEDALNDHLNNE